MELLQNPNESFVPLGDRCIDVARPGEGAERHIDALKRARMGGSPDVSDIETESNLIVRKPSRIIEVVTKEPARIVDLVLGVWKTGHESTIFDRPMGSWLPTPHSTMIIASDYAR